MYRDNKDLQVSVSSDPEPRIGVVVLCCHQVPSLVMKFRTLYLDSRELLNKYAVLILAGSWFGLQR